MHAIQITEFGGPEVLAWTDTLRAAGMEVGMGSEVTLWGRSRQGTVLPIDEVAQAAGTIGYELMCALAQRVPVVVEGDA